MIPTLWERVNYIAGSITWTKLGTLRDALSCIETSSINSEWELVMEYPMNGLHASDIQLMRLIYDGSQNFYIYRIAKNAAGHTMTVYGRHLNYLLSLMPALPFRNSSCSPQTFISTLTVRGLFNITSELTDTKSVDMFNDNVGPSSTRDYMFNDKYGMLGVYGGEWVFDNFNCTLKARKGTTKNITIRYGVDLIDARQDECIDNIVTHIVPYAYLSNQIKATVQVTDVRHVQWQYKFTHYVLYEHGIEYPKRYETVTNTPHLYVFSDSNGDTGTVSLTAVTAGSGHIYTLPGASSLPFQHVAAVNILDETNDNTKLLSLNWQKVDTTGSAVHLVTGAVHDDGTDSRKDWTYYNTDQSLEATGMTVYFQNLRTLAENYVAAHPVEFPVDITVKSLPEFMSGVQLGDTITVEYPDYGISTEAEITTMEYNVLQDRIESYTLGKGRTSFAETMLHQDNKIERLDGLVTANNPLKGI